MNFLKKKTGLFFNHHKFQTENYQAIFKKLLLWLEPPNAVYLRGNSQLHSGFSHDKKSLVKALVETRNFETKIF